MGVPSTGVTDEPPGRALAGACGPPGRTVDPAFNNNQQLRMKCNTSGAPCPPSRTVDPCRQAGPPPITATTLPRAIDAAPALLEAVQGDNLPIGSLLEHTHDLGRSRRSHSIQRLRAKPRAKPGAQRHNEMASIAPRGNNELDSPRGRALSLVHRVRSQCFMIDSVASRRWPPGLDHRAEPGHLLRPGRLLHRADVLQRRGRPGRARGPQGLDHLPAEAGQPSVLRGRGRGCQGQGRRTGRRPEGGEPRAPSPPCRTRRVEPPVRRAGTGPPHRRRENRVRPGAPSPRSPRRPSPGRP